MQVKSQYDAISAQNYSLFAPRAARSNIILLFCVRSLLKNLFVRAMREITKFFRRM